MAIKDFDAYLNERRKVSVNGFRMFGVEYKLPPTIPFDAVLLFKEIQDRGDDAKVEYDDLVPVMEAIIGKDVFAVLRSHQEFDLDILVQLLNHVMSSYNKVDTTDPKVAAVKRAKRSQ